MPEDGGILQQPALIRPGKDQDAAGFIALIDACWADYPGCVMDLDNEAPELRALASHYAARGGALWAAEADGAIVGMVAVAPDGAAWQVGKMYVASPQRGTGLAHALLDRAEAHARGAGADRITLWSDTRFDAAHRFYEKRGYLRTGKLRALGDLSNSIEFHFARPLSGVVVERLNAAAAASAERPLADLLKACVDAGASVSFLPPLELSVARGFWHTIATAVALDRRILIVAWADGVLAGCVTLDLATPPNQPHRAEVQKLLVHPAQRRRGLGRALMAAAEAAAVAAGRDLLTLDTTPGNAAEPLYRALGWTEAGRIPGYALDAAGNRSDTLLFYRQLQH